MSTLFKRDNWTITTEETTPLYQNEYEEISSLNMRSCNSEKRKMIPEEMAPLFQGENEETYRCYQQEFRNAYDINDRQELHGRAKINDEREYREAFEREYALEREQERRRAAEEARLRREELERRDRTEQQQRYRQDDVRSRTRDWACSTPRRVRSASEYGESEVDRHDKWMNKSGIGGCEYARSNSSDNSRSQASSLIYKPHRNDAYSLRYDCCGCECDREREEQEERRRQEDDERLLDLFVAQKYGSKVDRDHQSGSGSRNEWLKSNECYRREREECETSDEEDDLMLMKFCDCKVGSRMNRSREEESCRVAERKQIELEECKRKALADERRWKEREEQLRQEQLEEKRQKAELKKKQKELSRKIDQVKEAKELDGHERIRKEKRSLDKLRLLL